MLLCLSKLFYKAGRRFSKELAVRLPTRDELELAFMLCFLLALWGAMIFAFATEQGHIFPRQLKTFEQMKRAFRRGKNKRDNRRVAAIYAMRDFAEAANANQREEIAN